MNNFRLDLDLYVQLTNSIELFHIDLRYEEQEGREGSEIHADDKQAVEYEWKEQGRGKSCELPRVT